MSRPPRRHYTDDQKAQAVLLAESIGPSIGPASAARQLERAELQMRLETRGPDSCIQRHGCSHMSASDQKQTFNLNNDLGRDPSVSPLRSARMPMGL